MESTQAKVKPLDESTASAIRKSQIITKVSDVVRELVENSIDAGATTIQITLEKFGLDKIEVRDDGHGFSAEDVQKAFRGGHTSKLKDSSNLSRGHEFGFKGEALNAICAIGNVTVMSKPKGEASTAGASKYQFNSSGALESSSECGRVAHNVGTTVSVSNIFERFPVRRQWMQQSKAQKSDLEDTKTFLQAVGLASPSCFINLMHNSNAIFTKAKVRSVEQALHSVYGYNVAKRLLKCGPFSVDAPQATPSLSQAENSDDSGQITTTIELYLPKKPVDMRVMSFTSNKMAMIFCNRKRVYIKEFEKLIHRYIIANVDKTQPAHQRRYPISVFFIHVPPSDADFNRDLDKTKVFLVHKDKIHEALENALISFYEVDLRNPPVGVDDGLGQLELTGESPSASSASSSTYSGGTGSFSTPNLTSAPAPRAQNETHSGNGGNQNPPNKYQQFLEGRMTDRFGGLIETVVPVTVSASDMNNKRRGGDKDKDSSEAFRTALFAGTKKYFNTVNNSQSGPSATQSSTWNLTSRTSFGEPPEKRLRSTPSPSPIPCSSASRSRSQIPTSQISSNRQITLDGMNGWPAAPPITVFTQPVPVSQQIVTTSLKKSDDTSTLSQWSPMQFFLDNLPQYSLKPTVHKQIGSSDKTGPIYMAQSDKSIGVFCPLNMLKFFPEDFGHFSPTFSQLQSPSQTDEEFAEVYFTEQEVSQLFQEYLKRPDVNSSRVAGKIYNILRTVSELKSDLSNSLKSFQRPRLYNIL